MITNKINRLIKKQSGIGFAASLKRKFSPVFF
jgi:hypothetical protein